MEDKEFLHRLKEYIEQAEATIEAEFGVGRELAELIDTGEMPDVYAEVLRRLQLDDQATERERCAKLCDAQAQDNTNSRDERYMAELLAAAIRA